MMKHAAQLEGIEADHMLMSNVPLPATLSAPLTGRVCVGHTFLKNAVGKSVLM